MILIKMIMMKLMMMNMIKVFVKDMSVNVNSFKVKYEEAEKKIIELQKLIFNLKAKTRH